LVQKKLSVPDQITIRCCGCSGEVTFVVPKTDDDYPTMMHTVPMCGRFDETNTAEGIVQYMRDCSDARELN